ncbi:MAG: hypothetical protein F9K40_03085 [Kofleriaceae bacterium]|nr:MAG: hypothetical protein F9K40_03085 [Kofleriaceae bacterium]
MKLRLPQAMLTRGLASGCPIERVTGGLIHPLHTRVAAIGRRHGTNTTPTYFATVEVPLAARPTTFREGDHVDPYDLGLAVGVDPE